MGAGDGVVAGACVLASFTPCDSDGVVELIEARAAGGLAATSRFLISGFLRASVAAIWLRKTSCRCGGRFAIADSISISGTPVSAGAVLAAALLLGSSSFFALVVIPASAFLVSAAALSVAFAVAGSAGVLAGLVTFEGSFLPLYLLWNWCGIE